jgi:hypothetical protein
MLEEQCDKTVPCKGCYQSESGRYQCRELSYHLLPECLLFICHTIYTLPSVFKKLAPSVSVTERTKPYLLPDFLKIGAVMDASHESGVIEFGCHAPVKEKFKSVFKFEAPIGVRLNG